MGDELKKIIIVLSCVFVIGLIFSTGNANQIYQWTDKDGVKHFSNTPPDIDIQETVKATKEIPITPDRPSAVKQKVEKSPDATITKKQPYQNNRVELFSTSWCKYCKMARAFLIENSIPFQEYDIEKDKVAAERKKKLSGRSGVPFALINGKSIYGFSKGSYARALGLE